MVTESKTIITFLRILTFVSGCGLIALGIFSFISLGFGDGIRGFFLKIYYILFGLLVCFSEMPCEKLLSFFYFLRLNIGKALFLLFLATITFTYSNAFYLVVSIVFACASVLYCILFCTCSKPDEENKEEKPDAKFEKREDVENA